MPATLECARAEVTTGEWAGALREVFGEFRAPTGVSGSVGVAEATPVRSCLAVRAQVATGGDELGAKLRLLVGKPGLDGHSNGAEQIAVRARDAGFEVIYQGIRLTPSRSSRPPWPRTSTSWASRSSPARTWNWSRRSCEGLREAEAGDIPVVVGGIIPEADAAKLRELGVAAVFTPKTSGSTRSWRALSTSSAPPASPPLSEPGAAGCRGFAPMPWKRRRGAARFGLRRAGAHEWCRGP
jgi:(2R)-ethylmalonyl-CoA mutase